MTPAGKGRVGAVPGAKDRTSRMQRSFTVLRLSQRPEDATSAPSSSTR